jgi:hypothetical protein
VDLGRRQRKREPWIIDLREGDAGREVGRARPARDHGDRAMPNSIHDEARAIRLRPGERDEDVVARHLAAVEGDAMHGLAGGLSLENLGEEVSARLYPVIVMATVIGRDQREPQAPSRAISGNGAGGGSKRGLSPRIGAARSITLPVVTPAFQAAVE